MTPQREHNPQVENCSSMNSQPIQLMPFCVLISRCHTSFPPCVHSLEAQEEGLGLTQMCRSPGTNWYSMDAVFLDTVVAVVLRDLATVVPTNECVLNCWHGSLVCKGHFGTRVTVAESSPCCTQCVTLWALVTVPLLHSGLAYWARSKGLHVSSTV